MNILDNPTDQDYFSHHPHSHLSNLPFLSGNKGGRRLAFPCVQIGTLITGRILILADLVLSNPFFILFTCFSLFPDPSLPWSMVPISTSELEDEDEDEEEDGDKVEARCFFSLNNSFHRTVHLGGRGDGSSSTNQLTRLSSLFAPSSSCSSSFFVLRLILLSFSECCLCQKGRSFPSKKSSSAVNMVWLVELLERNSKSVFRAFSWSISCCFSFSEFGLIEMKFFSSRKSEEKEIRGLTVGSMDLELAWTASRETILVGVGCKEEGKRYLELGSEVCVWTYAWEQ